MCHLDKTKTRKEKWNHIFNVTAEKINYLSKDLHDKCSSIDFLYWLK